MTRDPKKGRHAQMRGNGIDPEAFEAVIFDLDGVITETADAHAAAWKELFDTYNEEREERGGQPFRPFDLDRDYPKHLDGKPRYDGVRDFLASRGIKLPEGSPDDPPDAETVCGLGNRKNRHFQEWLKANKVKTYDDAVRFISVLREAGIRTGIISSSKNCAAVLHNAGVSGLFDVKVDGVDMASLGLPGKPEPTIFHEAAARLGV